MTPFYPDGIDRYSRGDIFPTVKANGSNLADSLSAWAGRGCPSRDQVRGLLSRLGQKYSLLSQALAPPIADPPPPLIRSKEARIMLGGRGVLDKCEKAGWFTPVSRGKRMTLYRRIDIEAALQRIEWGEL
jgi:hypothetical protein